MRQLRESDLPDLLALCRAAGWNQTADDWLRVMRLDPEFCLGAEVDGQVAATAVAITFEKKMAWIGMVLTHPDFRGQGLARTLMSALLAKLDAAGIEVQKLDATDMGRPLYLQLGFADEQPVERWKRPATLTGPEPLIIEPYQYDAEFDSKAFGWDRARVMEMLREASGGATTEGGFALGRPGAHTTYFGPCVAKNYEAARRLARWFLARHVGEDVFWDLLPSNGQAVRLAKSFGFEPSRKLTRMARVAAGKSEPPRRDDYVYAIAGFEFG